MNHFRGELKVGAVYQSAGFRGMRRRIESIKDGVIVYTIYHENRTLHPIENKITEKEFRNLTSYEVPVATLDREEAAREKMRQKRRA